MSSPMTALMDSSWNLFTRWLGTEWPEGLRLLNPPASEDDIGWLEALIGYPLPRDLADCLRIHDGQRPNLGVLFDGCEFLSTRRIADEWSVWKKLLDDGHFEGQRSEPEDGIRPSWWNAAWIPFTYDGAGNHLCLDLDPAEGGRSGQVITMSHDDPTRERVAASLGEWFEAYVAGVLAGRYVHAEEYDGIVRREDV